MGKVNALNNDFALANDFDFNEAIWEFYTTVPPLNRANMFQTIGDRVRFIEALRERGFEIIKIDK